MKAPSLRVLALASLPAFGACADTSGPAPIDTGFTVTVAPLELDGIGEACYEIEIAGAEGTVVYLPEVCSGDYGNEEGGDITYIAPCDASPGADVDTGDGSLDGVQNTVTVWPYLYDAEGNDLEDWEDPCGDAGCQLEATCAPNADTLVEFNFTIMRDAQQGFFDVAINFEDIFCSAKLDSCYDTVQGAPTYSTAQFTHPTGTVTGFEYTDGRGKSVYLYWDATANRWYVFELPDTMLGGADLPPGPDLPGKVTVQQTSYTLVEIPGPVSGTPMALLHGDSGREHTAVAALACSAGEDSAGTTLLMTQPVVKCDGGVFFSLSLGDDDGGNETATWGEGIDEKTLEYAVYFGEEDLDCGAGAGSCQKVYYNIAINIEHLADQGLDNCRLIYVATATETPANGFDETTLFDADGEFTDDNGIYPGIGFGPANGDLAGALLTGDDGPLCFAHPLNGEGSAVQTGYLRGKNMTGANAEGFAASFYFDGGETAGTFGE